MAGGGLLLRIASRATGVPPARDTPSPSAEAPLFPPARPVSMVDESAFIDSWQSPFTKDPFEIPLESQLALLLAADAEMRRVRGVTLTETDMQFRKIDSWFSSSIGSRIHQRKVISGCGIVATSFH